MFLAEHSTFEGGEILDDEKLSEIRSKVYGSDATETEETTDIIAQDSKPIQNETDINSYQSSSFETESSDSSDEQNIVYWTESGEVWHLKNDCRYLKNKKIMSGTLDDAKEAGKDRLCSACSK